MRQEDSKSAIISPNGCGCLLLLMCIGIIGGIALPSFLNASNKPMLSEAKQYVSSMNKGQHAYFAEKSVFGTSIEALGLGMKTETANYKYSLRATKKTAFNYGVSKQKELKSYVGGVFIVTYKNEITTTSILCQADSPGIIKPAEPIYQNGDLICGKGTTQVTK
ncbi:MAG: general secretion pathway protein GspH [Oscillatoriales cyanobacterium]|uniref:type IV pilin-like G/H family protein n=1 Tax=Microcoleus anatoxicus TaxID=2705319 RepID=UPI002974F661|nr:MAG: general secretion pathway protein GspH [Oscillatoriales cyanobacterium]TAF37749.1 MAG: general secretion pathway protein GspH [Oscillatoriales cyanobacterium]TAF71497.1 MAG: general secretion pathway protein GspH [Oscillatoriales cyanobacterium]